MTKPLEKQMREQNVKKVKEYSASVYPQVNVHVMTQYTPTIYNKDEHHKHGLSGVICIII